MLLVFLSPALALAQGTPTPTPAPACTGGGLGQLICNLKVLINALLPLIISLGVVYLVWGIIRYVIAGGEEAKSKGRDQIIYGIIGLVVIVGLWGLVNIVVTTFNIGGANVPDFSQLSVQVPNSAGGCTEISKNSKFADVLNYFTCIIGKSVIPFLFAIATVMFIWGTINFFIINADEEAKRAQGRQFMIWGIIALAVMVSVWGLVHILGSTFGLETNFLPQVKP